MLSSPPPPRDRQRVSAWQRRGLRAAAAAPGSALGSRLFSPFPPPRPGLGRARRAPPAAANAGAGRALVPAAACRGSSDSSGGCGSGRRPAALPRPPPPGPPSSGRRAGAGCTARPPAVTWPSCSGAGGGRDSASTGGTRRSSKGRAVPVAKPPPTLAGRAGEAQHGRSAPGAGLAPQRWPYRRPAQARTGGGGCSAPLRPALLCPALLCQPGPCSESSVELSRPSPKQRRLLSCCQTERLA